MKLPNQPVFDLSYGLSFYSTATGKDIPLSPLGSRDVWGFDNGARALPSGIPDDKIVRQGIYTPDVGYPPSEITNFGRMFENRVDGRRTRAATQVRTGAPPSAIGSSNLGVVASVTPLLQGAVRRGGSALLPHRSPGQLEAASDYHMHIGTQRAQLGMVGNLSYQFSRASESPWKTSTRTAAATRAGSSRGSISTTLASTGTPGCSSSKRGCSPMPPAASTSSRDCRAAASTGAQTSRVRLGTSQTCGRRSTNGCSAALRVSRLPTPTNPRAASGCSTSWKTTRSTGSSTGASSTRQGAGPHGTSSGSATWSAAGISSHAAFTTFRLRPRRRTPATSCSTPCCRRRRSSCRATSARRSV